MISICYSRALERRRLGQVQGVLRLRELPPGLGREPHLHRVGDRQRGRASAVDIKGAAGTLKFESPLPNPNTVETGYKVTAYKVNSAIKSPYQSPNMSLKNKL